MNNSCDIEPRISLSTLRQGKGENPFVPPRWLLMSTNDIGRVFWCGDTVPIPLARMQAPGHGRAPRPQKHIPHNCGKKTGTRCQAAQQNLQALFGFKSEVRSTYIRQMGRTKTLKTPSTDSKPFPVPVPLPPSPAGPAGAPSLACSSAAARASLRAGSCRGSPAAGAPGAPTRGAAVPCKGGCTAAVDMPPAYGGTEDVGIERGEVGRQRSSLKLVLF